MLAWMIVGFLLGVGAIMLRRNPHIKLAWFDWVMLVLAVVFFVLAVVNYTGSMEELEPRAANFLLASFGLPGLIFTAIVGVRALRSRSAAPPAAPAADAPKPEAAT